MTKKFITFSIALSTLIIIAFSGNSFASSSTNFNDIERIPINSSRPLGNEVKLYEKQNNSLLLSCPKAIHHKILLYVPIDAGSVCKELQYDRMVEGIPLILYIRDKRALINYTSKCVELSFPRVKCSLTLNSVSLSALAKIQNLDTLDLKFTNVKKISALAKSRVRILDLRSTKVIDVFDLPKFKGLSILYLGNTKVKEVSCLSKVENLDTLDLTFTKVKEVSGLSDSKSLRTVYLGKTKIINISHLANKNINIVI